MPKSFAVKKSVQRGEEEVVVGCPLGGRYVDRDYNASTNIAHKLMGLWSEELLEKKDKMPLKFYFINKKNELPVYRMIKLVPSVIDGLTLVR